jgi:hypothetical protein
VQRIVTPRSWAEGIPGTQQAKVVATAWGLQLRVNSATDPRLRAFVERYHGGGQGGEPGGVCER